MKYLGGFKTFCEEESPKQDYFASLEDEMGIDKSDMQTAISKEPWISSHFDLGNIKYKQSAWEIVPGSMSDQGADIRLKPQIGNRSYLNGNKVNKSSSDTQRYHLNSKELQQFLTTGWTPAVSAAQQGQMPGMM